MSTSLRARLANDALASTSSLVKSLWLGSTARKQRVYLCRLNHSVKVAFNDLICTSSSTAGDGVWPSGCENPPGCRYCMHYSSSTLDALSADAASVFHEHPFVVLLISAGKRIDDAPSLSQEAHFSRICPDVP